MAPKSRAIFFVFAGYPVVIHTAVIMDKVAIGYGVLLAMVFIHMMVNMYEQRHRKLKLFWVMLIGISVASCLAAVAYHWGATSALFIPPVLLNLVLMLVFGKSLLPGNVSIITQLRKMVRKEEPTPEIYRYTRQVTWVWTIFFAGLAAESAVLAMYFSLDTWSLFTNIINYVLIVVLFFGEYFYRIHRIKEVGGDHTSPMKLISEIANNRSN